MDELSEAVAVLLDLDTLGVRLDAEGDRLRFTPKEAVTLELVERIKACKQTLWPLFVPIAKCWTPFDCKRYGVRRWPS